MRITGDTSYFCSPRESSGSWMTCHAKIAPPPRRTDTVAKMPSPPTKSPVPALTGGRIPCVLVPWRLPQVRTHSKSRITSFVRRVGDLVRFVGDLVRWLDDFVHWIDDFRWHIFDARSRSTATTIIGRLKGQCHYGGTTTAAIFCRFGPAWATFTAWQTCSRNGRIVPAFERPLDC